MSVNVNSLKRSRAAFRGFCTKYNIEAEKLLSQYALTSDHFVRLEQLATLLESKLNQITRVDLQIQGHTEINEIEDTISEASDANDIIFQKIHTIRRRVCSENAPYLVGGGKPCASCSGSAAISRQVASAKLPKLNLPTFKGDYVN